MNKKVNSCPWGRERHVPTDPAKEEGIVIKRDDKIKFSPRLRTPPWAKFLFQRSLKNHCGYSIPQLLFDSYLYTISLIGLDYSLLLSISHGPRK